MTMPIVIALLVAAAVWLVVVGLQGEPPERAIQQRIYKEFGEVVREDQFHPGWLKWLSPLVTLHQRLGVRATERVLADRFISGRVSLSQLEFLVLRELGALFMLGVYAVLRNFKGLDPVWFIGAGVAGFIIPDVWLRRRIAARRVAIARDLPEIVDLLTLCVEAGADLMSSMQRVVREYRPCPLREELGVLLQEVNVGKRRRDAFLDLAGRLKIPDVTTFSRTIVHSDRMGTGMVQTLRILAEDSRLRRHHQAERFAQQAPLKMLIPLMLVMGSVLLIVAGPVMLQFLKGDLFAQMR